MKDGAVRVQVHDFEYMVVERVINDRFSWKIDVFFSQFPNYLQKLQFGGNTILRFKFHIAFSFHYQKILKNKGKTQINDAVKSILTMLNDLLNFNSLALRDFLAGFYGSESQEWK